MDVARFLGTLILFTVVVGMLAAWGCAWIFRRLDARREARDNVAAMAREREADRVRLERASRRVARLRGIADVPAVPRLRPREPGVDVRFTARRVEVGLLSEHRQPVDGRTCAVCGGLRDVAHGCCGGDAA